MDSCVILKYITLGVPCTYISGRVPFSLFSVPWFF